MPHSVLLRQLARLGLDEAHPPDPAGWAEFLKTVSAAYHGHDQDRYLLERSLTLSSKEMGDLHAALRRDREQLAAVIDSLDQGLIVLNRDLIVEIVNPEAARIIGVPAADLLKWTVHDLRRCIEDDPSLAAMFEKVIAHTAGESSGRGECDDGRLRSADGRSVAVSASVISIQDDDQVQGVVVVLRDISLRQRMELDLRQSQKLEAVGRLAAGVAHEINTPMQFVGDNLVFIESSVAAMMRVLDAAQHVLAGAVPDDDTYRSLAHAVEDCDVEFLSDELPQALSQSLEGIDRVTTIVGAMKSFSHPGAATAAPADLNQALRDTVIVARGELRAIADVILNLTELPLVVCLLHELKQVFLNFVINAAQAIAERALLRPGRGSIIVTTAARGDCVVITIGDDGGGIPDHALDQIFEPFFTTKEVGRGSGQGLAMAHRVIIDGHHGKLTFTTEAGVGTTFEIQLPVLGV